MKPKLLIPERNTLRRTFGPTKDRNVTWRIATNDELNNLVKNKDIINYIKAQNLSFFGHVHRITVGRWSQNYVCVCRNRKLEDY